MKKIMLLLFLGLPFFVSAQKIQNAKTKEVVELKQKVETYCTVVQQPYKGKIAFFVGTDELGVWNFINQSRQPIKFQTIIAVMNYMHKNGWEYVNNIGGVNGAAPQYFFRKKE